MRTLSEIGWFAFASVILAITPGPNMICCVSRTLVLGRGAGLVSLFPQFIHPERGSVLLQSMQLGAAQMTASAAINPPMIFGAAGITAVPSKSEGWLRAQRYVMGSVLAALAVRVALTERQ